MIVLSKENALLQVSELTKQHPLLSITESNNSFIRLRGEIDVYRTAFNYTLDRSYHVEIVIPINSSELPIVKDLDGIIDSSYPHRYGNGELCLETDSAIRWHFLDGFHLEEWVKEYVEPYFFSYEYYSRFGIFPFGERPHGLEGILDTYSDMLHVADRKQIASLLKFCAYNRYRGHVICPCGSGIKLRKCHGKIVFPLMTDQRKIDIIRLDIESIRKAITQK